MCSMRDCLVSPLFDHKGTKPQRIEGENFVFRLQFEKQFRIRPDDDQGDDSANGHSD